MAFLFRKSVNPFYNTFFLICHHYAEHWSEVFLLIDVIKVSMKIIEQSKDDVREFGVHNEDLQQIVQCA